LVLALLGGIGVIRYIIIGTASLEDTPYSNYITPPDSRFQTSSIRLHRILEIISKSIQDSIGAFDPKSTYEELAIRVPKTSTSDYLTDVVETFGNFFSEQQRNLLETAISYIHLLPNQAAAEPIERTIYTTDLVEPDKFVDQFKSWTEINPGWKVRYTGDDEIDEWLKSVFGEESGVLKEMLWLRKRGVVRADLFR